MNGLALWLFAATKATDKSVRANSSNSMTNEIRPSAPWTIATPRICRPLSIAPRKLSVARIS